MSEATNKEGAGEGGGLEAELDALTAQIEALEAKRRDVYRRSLEAPEVDKVAPDFLARMMAEPLPSATFPLTIRGIVGDGAPLVQGGRKNVGAFVAVRPVSPETAGKSFLGVYLGDIATAPSCRINPRDGVMLLGLGMHNPAMWVPDLNRVVFGMESWWGPIESETQLRQITDADIANVWYVRALKELHERVPPAPAPAPDAT